VVYHVASCPAARAGRGPRSRAGAGASAVSRTVIEDSREVVVGRPGVFGGALPLKSVGRRIRGRRKYVRRATGVRLQE
jgi:hypothetical protein